MSQASVSVKMQHLLAKILENVDLKKLLAPSTIAVVCICIMEPPPPHPKISSFHWYYNQSYASFSFFFFFFRWQVLLLVFFPELEVQ